MPVAIALVFAVVVLAVCLIGFLWSLAFLLPFYACIAVAAYLLWRVDRNRTNMTAFVEREAKKQRLFNEQETNAWRTALEKDRRPVGQRERALRAFNTTREPPKK